jgi:hypothetical protein
MKKGVIVMKSFARLVPPIVGLFVCSGLCLAQTPPPLSFYPYRAGNVWQYRDSYNNDIFYTRYNDFDSVGIDRTVFIRARLVPENTAFQERIDTAANVFSWYGSGPPPIDTLYNLTATVGQSWQGWRNDIRITLASIQSAVIFGRLSTVKQFNFTLAQPPPREPLVFRRDYLASGFGLVQQWYEPNLLLYLAGAIIDSVRWGIIVGIDEERDINRDEFVIYQNYPNPFNPITTINFDMRQRERVRLTVFDILGREVAVLVDGEKERGIHSVVFNARGVSSGVYFYRLRAGGAALTKKMIVQK